MSFASPALLWLADRPALCGLIGLILAWGWANVWKFNPPKSAFGMKVLKAVTSMTITAWNEWGKGKGWTPLPSIQEFEKEWSDGSKEVITVEHHEPPADAPKVLDETEKVVEVSLKEKPRS